MRRGPCADRVGRGEAACELIAILWIVETLVTNPRSYSVDDRHGDGNEHGDNTIAKTTRHVGYLRMVACPLS